MTGETWFLSQFLNTEAKLCFATLAWTEYKKRYISLGWYFKWKCWFSKGNGTVSGACKQCSLQKSNEVFSIPNNLDIKPDQGRERCQGIWNESWHVLFSYPKVFKYRKFWNMIEHFWKFNGESSIYNFSVFDTIWWPATNPGDMTTEVYRTCLLTFSVLSHQVALILAKFRDDSLSCSIFLPSISSHTGEISWRFSELLSSFWHKLALILAKFREDSLSCSVLFGINYLSYWRNFVRILWVAQFFLA